MPRLQQHFRGSKTVFLVSSGHPVISACAYSISFAALCGRVWQNLLTLFFHPFSSVFIGSFFFVTSLACFQTTLVT